MSFDATPLPPQGVLHAKDYTTPTGTPARYPTTSNHLRLVGYLTSRLLNEAVVVVGATVEDAAAALRQCLRIAGARDLPLELVAPDRFLPFAKVRERGVSKYLADSVILTEDAFTVVNDPVTGPLLALPGEDRWVYQGIGRFDRRTTNSEALASRTAVEPGVDGPQVVRLEGDGC